MPCVLGRELANLIGLEGVAKDSAGSADIHFVLGRESANLIGLGGVAKDSADVPCVLVRESANLIGLEGVAKSSADVHCVLERDSANLIELAGMAKVICNEQAGRYETTERVNHRRTDSIGAGKVESRPERFLKDTVTDVAGKLNCSTI